MTANQSHGVKPPLLLSTSVNKRLKVICVVVNTRLPDWGSCLCLCDGGLDRSCHRRPSASQKEHRKKKKKNLPAAAQELKSFFDISRFMLKLPLAFIPRCNLDSAAVSLVGLTRTLAGMQCTHTHMREQNLCIYAFSPQLVQRDVHITPCWRSAF